MISKEMEARVREIANHRCGYCLSPQKYVMGKLEMEHLWPRSKGGTDEEENLWIACRLCNGFKGDQTHGFDPETEITVSLFNPRKQIWSEHFAWSEDGTHIIGLTVYGRATVNALELNNAIAVIVRQQWVEVGWHPPKD